MKHILFAATLTSALLGAGAALAGDDKCRVSEAEWQSKEALRAKLEGEGWTVNRVKVDDGCYEVYGLTDEGKRMEAYFDPKTFDLVKAERED